MERVRRSLAAAQDLADAGGDDTPVEIAADNPAWRQRFAAERARLVPILGLEVHHIGSTAVPGLAAKPIVDVMALVDDFDAHIPVLVGRVGYVYPTAYNAALDGRRWLCRPSARQRRYHLHPVSARAELVRRLAFRDALRADAALAAEYAQLKRELALRFGADREGYGAAKTAFVSAVLA